MENFIEKNKINHNLVRERFKNELRDKINQNFIEEQVKPNTSFSTKPTLKIIGGITGVLFSTVFGFLLISSLLSTPEPFEDPSEIIQERSYASVSFQKGTVEISNSNNWNTITQDTEINKGDSIRVLKDGKATLQFNNGTIVRINSDSQIRIDELAEDRIKINHKSGTIYSRVSDSGDSFSVLIQDTEYIATGTAFKTINLPEKKGIRVYESSVRIVEKDLDNDEIIVSQGEKFFNKVSDDDSLEGTVFAMTHEEIKNDEFAIWNMNEDIKIQEFKDKLGIFVEINLKDENLVIAEDKETETTNNTDNEEVVGTITQPTEENKIMPNSTPTLTITLSPTKISEIKLSGYISDKSAKFKWNVQNINTENGFKLVASNTTEYPTYPNNTNISISDGNQRSEVIELTEELGLIPDENYYIRICRYTGNKCDYYSNSITLRAPSAQNTPTPKPTVTDNPTPTPTITTSVTINLEHTSDLNVSWQINTPSPNGYKLIWSPNSMPEYPPRNGDDNAKYYSNSNTSSALIDYEAKQYEKIFVRVCNYTGGVCGTYSNQISIDIPAATPLPTV